MLADRRSNVYFRSLYGRRPLRLEALEARHALSTLAGAEADACLVVEPAPVTVVEVDSQPQAVGEEPVAPLDSDAYFALLTATTTEETTDPPPPPPPSNPPPPAEVPPIITQFQGQYNGSLLVLGGRVADDEPTYLCRVEFSGGVTGSTSVLADGTFTFQALMPAPGTTIWARAVDADGLYSPWYEVTIVA